MCLLYTHLETYVMASGAPYSSPVADSDKLFDGHTINIFIILNYLYIFYKILIDIKTVKILLIIICK